MPPTSPDAASVRDSGGAHDGGDLQDAAALPDGAVAPDSGTTSLPALAFSLGPRMQALVTVPVLADAVLELVTAPAAMLATIEAGQIALRPTRSARGEQLIEYRLVRGVESWNGTLVVVMDSTPYAALSQGMFRVRLTPHLEAESFAGTRFGWWNGGAGILAGSLESAASQRAATLQSGVLDVLAVGTARRHRTGNVEAGALEGAPALYELGLGRKLPWPGALGSAYEQRAGVLAATVQDPIRFGDAMPRGLRCANESYASCTVVQPDGAAASALHALDDAGRAVGCARVADRWQPMVAAPNETGVIEPSLHGCLHGFDDQGAMLGMAEGADGEQRALRMAGGEIQQIRFARQLGAWLHDGRGGLLGGARGYDGVPAAAELLPWQVPAAISIGVAAESDNPDLAHACGHGEGGPFLSLVAGSAASAAPTFQNTHTYYTVTRTSREAPAYVALENPIPGKLTLHFGEPVAVRITAPSGAVVPLAYADDTGRCPKARAFLQYPVAEAGRYIIELGPSASNVVHFVYERGYAIQLD